MARQYTRTKTPRVLITNAKGGSGKTTLTTNLAAFYAQQRNVSVMDFDAQQSSSHWASLRSTHLNPVQVLPGYKPNQLNQTRSWQLRTPPQCDLVLMDTPAAMPNYALEEVIQYSDIILIPVSALDHRHPSGRAIHLQTAANPGLSGKTYTCGHCGQSGKAKYQNIQHTHPLFNVIGTARHHHHSRHPAVY